MESRDDYIKIVGKEPDVGVNSEESLVINPDNLRYAAQVAKKYADSMDEFSPEKIAAMVPDGTSVDKESSSYREWKKMVDDISQRFSGRFSVVNYQMIDQFARGVEKGNDEVGEFRPIDIDSFDVVSDGETSAIVEKSDGMDELDNMINGVAVDADSLEKRSLDELDKMFFDGAYDYDNGGKSMRR